jgi:biopolymer transport protein ExbB
MAHGISQAMIATVLGLGIAIPLLFGTALLTSMSRTLESVLDGQSSGMLADMIEKRNAR